MMSKSEGGPHIGVVIPSYNNRRDVVSCLESILSESSSLTVVVVDNNSSDDTVEYVAREFPQVEIIQEKKNSGYVGAVNRGWALLRERGVEYLMIATQDVIFGAGWLEPLVQAMADPRVAAAQPLLCYQDNHERVNSAGNRIHYLGFGYAEGDGLLVSDSRIAPLLVGAPEVVYASGGAVLLRAAVIEQIGLFQSDFFMYHDDLDFGWRARLAGYQSVLVAESRAYHRYEFHRSTAIKYEFGERNRLLVLLENYHAATLLLLFPAWFVMEVGIVATSLLNGWFRLKWRGYLYVIKNLSHILEMRRRHQALRIHTDKEVMRGFVGNIHYQNQPSALLALANPVFDLYWQILRRVIFW